LSHFLKISRFAAAFNLGAPSAQHKSRAHQASPAMAGGNTLSV
jgi:hypothetical protein